MRDRGPMTYLEAADRYLRIVAWARKRYRFMWGHPDQMVVYLYYGNVPAPYTRIEEAAWNRYMCPELCRTPSTGREGDARP